MSKKKCANKEAEKFLGGIDLSMRMHATNSRLWVNTDIYEWPIADPMDEYNHYILETCDGNLIAAEMWCEPEGRCWKSLSSDDWYDSEHVKAWMTMPYQYEPNWIPSHEKQWPDEEGIYIITYVEARGTKVSIFAKFKKFDDESCGWLKPGEEGSFIFKQNPHDERINYEPEKVTAWMPFTEGGDD